MSLHIIVFHSDKKVLPEFIKSTVEADSIMQMNNHGTAFLARSAQSAKMIHDKISKKDKDLSLTVFSSPSTGWETSQENENFRSWVIDGLNEDGGPLEA